MGALPVGRSHAPVMPRHYVPNPAHAASKAPTSPRSRLIAGHSWKSELALKTNLQRTLLVVITALPFRGGRRGVVTSQHTEAGRDILDRVVVTYVQGLPKGGGALCCVQSY